MAIKDELAKLDLDALTDIVPAPPAPQDGFDKATKEKALEILTLLRQTEINGGYRAIAATCNVPVKWVKRLDELRREVIAEKQAALAAEE